MNRSPYYEIVFDNQRTRYRDQNAFQFIQRDFNFHPGNWKILSEQPAYVFEPKDEDVLLAFILKLTPVSCQ